MCQSGTAKSAATLMTSFVEGDGSVVALRPRGCIEGFARQLDAECGIQILIGFEEEVTFC
jgi:hypothetical protein